MAATRLFFHGCSGDKMNIRHDLQGKKRVRMLKRGHREAGSWVRADGGDAESPPAPLQGWGMTGSTAPRLPSLSCSRGGKPSIPRSQR